MDEPKDGQDAFLRRLDEQWTELRQSLDAVYRAHDDLAGHIDEVVRTMAQAWSMRSAELRRLDDDRIAAPDWFQRPDMIGYVFYVDRFAGTLRGIEDHLGYLAELGVRYVHLMPVLRSRAGDSDGGYAVTDYGAIEPRLGTMDDLEHVAAQLRARGMSTCVDLVLNHTAAEHPWAERARNRDPEAADLYRIYPNGTIPGTYERTLPEVFPGFAPGNFTELADGRWVWTTFNRWQWDLNWENPRVFVEILRVLLALANRGVDVFRLDAVAFMWKRLGTNSQNQPEVHWLLRAMRACARIAAPAVIFKAEAIVGPDDLAPYLGVAAPGVPDGRECDLAYHNSLMVQFWSALAARDTRLMTHVLGTFPHKPEATAWATYLRCHDDIGWAITEDDAAAVGWSGPAHRAFLSSFYAGEFPGSFARGVVFQANQATGDSRINGTCASLAGLEVALERADPVDVDRAIDRILLGHALILGWNGIPLLFMGDEIGLRNDWRFLSEPDHASDNRWVHRPLMNWRQAGQRRDPRSVEGRIFAGLRRLIEVRRGLPQLHAAIPLEVVDLEDPALFAFVRGDPAGPLLAVHNLTEKPQALDPAVLARLGLSTAIDAIEPQADPMCGETLGVAPYSCRWLVARRPVSPETTAPLYASLGHPPGQPAEDLRRHDRERDIRVAKPRFSGSTGQRRS